MIYDVGYVAYYTSSELYSPFVCILILYCIYLFILEIRTNSSAYKKYKINYKLNM